VQVKKIYQQDSCLFRKLSPLFEFRKSQHTFDPDCFAFHFDKSEAIISLLNKIQSFALIRTASEFLRNGRNKPLQTFPHKTS